MYSQDTRIHLFIVPQFVETCVRIDKCSKSYHQKLNCIIFERKKYFHAIPQKNVGIVQKGVVLFNRTIGFNILVPENWIEVSV